MPFVVPPIPLYIGPDQFLPLTSALGAIMGLLLMFWTRVKAFFHRVFSLGKKKEADSPTGQDGN
jgi:hypothetical protein